MRLCCKHCFSMEKDKMLFVIKLQKRKKKVSFWHPSQKMNTLKCGKLIQMTTGYFLRWWTSYHSFPGPPLSKMAVSQISQLTHVCFTESNFGGLPTPHPPILGQTIDRCITCEVKLLYRFLQTLKQ